MLNADFQVEIGVFFSTVLDNIETYITFSNKYLLVIMKYCASKYLFVIAYAAASSSLFAALEDVNKMYGNENILWSSSGSWQNKEVPLPPNSNTAYIANEWNSISMSVDGDYTVGKIGSNSDTGYYNNGVFTYNMSGTAADGANGSINIDAAQNDSGSNAAIDIGLQGRSKAEIYDQNVVFSGGTVTIFDSSNPDRQLGVFVNSNITDLTQDYTKSLTFDSQTTLNSYNDIEFGTNTGGAEYRTLCINLFGNTNVLKQGDDSSIEYKTVEFSGGDGSSAYTNAVINIGDSAAGTKFLSGSVKQYAAVDVNVLGTMNVMGDYFINQASGIRTKFNVASGGKFEMATPAAGTEIKFTANNADIEIAGDFIITHDTSTKGAADGLYNSKMTVKNGGNVLITSENNGDVSLALGANSVLEVEEGGLVTVSKQLRIYGNNARVILHQENGLRSQEYNGKWKIIIGGVYSDVYVDLYANQDLYGISFWGDESAGNTTTLHLTLGENLTSLTLDTLVADGGTLTEYRLIDITGFKNNTIFVKSKNDEDLLSSISADGFKDFYWEETDGGWYLNAIAVPEPAFFASVFGFLALALALGRRRAS